MIDLYYKKISPNGKVTYHPLEAPNDAGAELKEITDQQAITVAVSLAVTAAMQSVKYLPPHKKVGREIDKMLAGVVDMVKGCGHPVDPALSEHMIWTWNMATRIAQLTHFE